MSSVLNLSIADDVGNALFYELVMCRTHGYRERVVF